MYVITGATGNTGRRIAEALLAQGKKVRVIGRSADRLKPLSDKGAEVFIGSLENASDVERAFAGAQAVYAMIPPNMAAQGFRAYQNRVADAFAAAVQKTGVKYVVTLSSVGAHRPDKTGPVKGLYDLEHRMNRLPNVNVLHLRPAYFMENLLTSIGLIKTMGINGGAVKADVPLPMIATQDIADAAARRLAALDFTGKTVQELQGQRDVTMVEVTRVLGKAIGMPDLAYVAFSYEDALNGMVGAGLPAEIASEYVELSRGINDGDVSFLEPRTAANSTPTPIEQFAPVFAAAYNRP